MLRSRYDGEILRLALPSLGALAAEPLYLLTDTAIVGHLGTPQLAALALAATVLSNLVALCIFLTYGTTARVTRLHGAGQDEAAAALGPQALWLALTAGVVVGATIAALAGPLVHALGGEDHVADMAARYLRIASIGVPMALIALAGQGWLRGMSDLRTPLVIVVAANVANVVLEVLFVYGFDWGLDGSAWGTVLAQLGMGAAFATVLLRKFAPPDLARIRSLVSIGAQLVVRTAALLGCFVLATAVCAHTGPATVAAHQIAFQLFGFLALLLDAIAIAGQVIVGRALGGGDADEAIAAARRMLEWSLAAGLVIGGVFLALADVVPHAFTSDPKVIDQAHDLWPLFCAMWPVAAIVFALDGILIGAGDTAYLAGAMVVAFVAFLPIVLTAETVAVVWVALDVLMLIRLATLGARFARRRWALVGAHA
ncbi:MAG TPA: MATE family efflux transporter [Solirubrobacteraceae bacterium]|nr:MATE family efflux transporter [Solirubrobacteraceae bacterium]